MYEHFWDSLNSAVSHFSLFSPPPHSWPPGSLPLTNPGCVRWLDLQTPQVQISERAQQPQHGGFSRMGFYFKTKSAGWPQVQTDMPGPVLNTPAVSLDGTTKI